MVKGALLCIAAAAAAAAAAMAAMAAGYPLPSSHHNLLKYAFNNNGQGQYSFEYETDESYRREDGGLTPSAAGDALIVRGEYWFIDPEGYKHTVKYIADKNGFQPQNENGNVRFNDRLLV